MARVKYKYDDFMNPVMLALKQLGGSGTNEEIDNRVGDILNIPSSELDVLHNPDKGGMTEIEYRLHWTRTYLKKYGVIENSSRGIWSLTPRGSTIEAVDQREVVRVVKEQKKKNKQIDIENDGEVDKEVRWQEELLEVILRMPPSSFERLIQRILRESGFVQVAVTGQTGDGGIDGHGILRLGGFLSFQIIFQAKRWKGSIGAGQIRDFRGAMVGRADKGLFITTGAFTKEAVKEATRDGAPAIDLVDGDQLVEKLKQLSLGVTTKEIIVQEVIIEQEWFASL
ncbi:MAG: restriction endonuclease [Lentisphaerae bacterium]|nr:restriction endonuclease [Lentisphaerota bacterium]